MTIEERIEYYKVYQSIIDEVTTEECIEVAKGIPINCNREEMIRESIIQRLYKADKKDELASHSESDILKECINLMHELVDDFAKWHEYVHGENAIAELDEEERFCVRKTYFSIVQQLFLYHTKHSGGGSTCAKCHELGIKDWSEDIEFGFEVGEDE